jgi:uncharacterized protein (DUF1800 family)
MRPSIISISLLLWATAASAFERDPASFRPLPEDQWTRGDAAHLLRRAAFGGSAVQNDEFFRLGLEAAVDRLVDYEDIPYQPAPPNMDRLLYEPPNYEELRKLGPLKRRELERKERRAHRASYEEVRLWWIERMVESPRPLEEVMTLFWHGHFTSGMREVRNALYMAEQNVLLRKHATGNFGQLVLDISRDRAMLVYLDGNKNHKEHPNENYARELLELFTLGEGNYSEQDIQEAARAFTGWNFNDEGFVFRGREHDWGHKVVFNRRGKWGGEDIVKLILKRRECSEYLADKLCEYFIRPDPDRKLIKAVARDIRRHDYDLKPVLRQLFMSEAFYHMDARGCKIKSPTVLLVGAARHLGVTISDLPAAASALQSMGQELLQPPNVKGWDGGEKWINTARLFHRYNTVKGLIHGTHPAPDRFNMLAEGAGGMTTMRGMSGKGVSRMKSGAQAEFDPLPIARDWQLETPQQAVNYFSRLLLAVPLVDSKREALTDFLAGEENDYSLENPAVPERLRVMVQLLMSSPEFQLY